jgi:hypothetical protein
MARKSKVPINMSTLLQTTTGTLAQIQTKTNSLTILADIVRHICPDLPVGAFQIANCREATMIIEVKSPVWGQRLQFERNKICNALIENTQGHFNQIQIKVNPQGFRQQRHDVTEKKQQQLLQSSSSVKPEHTNLFVNEKTAKQFMAVAKNAPKGLKEKLEKLAKVAGKKY